MTTEKGRVVYNRKKHEFRVRDVLNIMLKMSNRALPWWIGQELQCLSVFQVAERSFYPTWLNHQYGVQWKKLNSTQRIHQRMLLDEMNPRQLKEIIRDKTRKHCEDAVDAVQDKVDGFVEWAAKEIVFAFFDDIFNLIWDFWDPYFSAPTLGVW